VLCEELKLDSYGDKIKNDVKTGKTGKPTSGKDSKNFICLRGRSGERGKAGGHEPPPFPLPCHILAFFSSDGHAPPLFRLRTTAFDSFGQNYFFKWYI